MKFRLQAAFPQPGRSIARTGGLTPGPSSFRGNAGGLDTASTVIRRQDFVIVQFLAVELSVCLAQLCGPEKFCGFSGFVAKMLDRGLAAGEYPTCAYGSLLAFLLSSRLVAGTFALLAISGSHSMRVSTVMA